MGIVYIAVSDRMYYKDEDGELYEFVKIGVTKAEETIEARMKSLNGTSTPYPLECLYALDVGDKAREAERLIHKNLDRHRIRKGKYKREFFKIGRDEARRHLEVLEIMGGRDVTPDERDTVVDEDDKRIMREGVNKRKAFNFADVGMAPGTELHFLGDYGITCEVVDDRRIRFRNKVTYLSNAAAVVLKEKGRNKRKNPGSVMGTRYWAYEGRTLDTIRIEGEGASRLPSPVSASAPVNTKPQTRKPKPSFTFSALGISQGSVIKFTKDPSITSKVAGDAEVEYEGARYKLGPLTKKIMQEKFGVIWATCRGTDYWSYEGEILTHRRKRIEEGDSASKVPLTPAQNRLPAASHKKQGITSDGRVIDFSLDGDVYTKTSWQKAVIKVLESLKEHKDKIKAMAFPALRGGCQMNNEKYRYIEDLDITVATMSAKDGILILKKLKEDFNVNAKLRYRTKTGEVKTV